MADFVDSLVLKLLDQCDDVAGERMIDAINRIVPRNNATITMHAAQLIARQLAAVDDDLRDEYWAAFGRLMLLCLKRINDGGVRGE